MSNKYVNVRFPKEAYDNFKDKKNKMEEVVTQLIGKKLEIPMTKILIAVSKKPITIHDEQLLKLIKKKKIIKVKKVRVIK